MLNQLTTPFAHWLHEASECVQHRMKGLKEMCSVNVKKIGGDTFSLSPATVRVGGLILLLGGVGPKAKKAIEVIGLPSIFILAIVMCGSLRAIAHDGGPEVLRVKGLYLGMNMDEGTKIFREFITPEIAKKLGEGEPLEVTKISPFETCSYGFGFFPYGCPKIFLESDCSKEKKVYRISIHNDIADRMFDAELLSQEEFVQAFEKHYNITMKLRVKPTTAGTFVVKLWEFESRNGYKVTICEGHTIIVEELLK